METKQTPVLVKIQKEVSTQLASKEIMSSLISTTFKGLTEVSVKQAIVEGMMRGFEFKDFLEKNVYAVPFAGGYSLITSIDYARKIGMRSGVVGKTAPSYEFYIPEGEGKESILSCTITVKKKFDDYIGEFTETVYFDEYYSGVKSGRQKPTQWDSKPKTMIAKVAEMHALRQACPEELSKAYVEEELEQDTQKPSEAPKVNVKVEIMGLMKTLGLKDNDDPREKIKAFTGIEVEDDTKPEVLEEIKSRLQVLVAEKK